MATPRPVRIPRATPPPPANVGVSGAAPPSAPSASPSPTNVERRLNRAGSQRAFRLATIYLVALIAMYLGFVLLDRAGPGGTSASADTGILFFTLIATALAIGGVALTLAPVPRAVEISPDAVVVVEWSGIRRAFPPLGELRAQVVRRYPAGFLSTEPVEAVALGGRKGIRTYHLAQGLLPESRPSMAALDAQRPTSL